MDLTALYWVGGLALAIFAFRWYRSRSRKERIADRRPTTGPGTNPIPPKNGPDRPDRP